ncbi:unnamed protein product [Periconia digitata]|uniref:Uncharacterized protein n=1 Tax=Periconia digitata TaxID=1303443 RepID=A0A9W4UU19_9PLEO|nr:unnamed protein product [Periconia digitata]
MLCDRILNRPIPRVSTKLRPSRRSWRFTISSSVPYSKNWVGPRSPCGAFVLLYMTMPNCLLPSTHRRIISRYRGSKTWRNVGIVGKDSVHMNSGTSRSSSPTCASASTAFLRASIRSGHRAFSKEFSNVLLDSFCKEAGKCMPRRHTGQMLL